MSKYYKIKRNSYLQVADLHGELLEFNDRLHKQVNYYQYQVRRLREELVNLRGPVRSAQTKLSSSSLHCFLCERGQKKLTQ